MSSILIGGQDVTLRFHWRALKRAKLEVWGEADAMAFVGKAVETTDIDALAKLIAIAGVPVMAEESILEASPPLMSVADALRHALVRAYFGTDPFPVELRESENPTTTDEIPSTPPEMPPSKPELPTSYSGD